MQFLPGAEAISVLGPGLTLSAEGGHRNDDNDDQDTEVPHLESRMLRTRYSSRY